MRTTYRCHFGIASVLLLALVTIPSAPSAADPPAEFGTTTIVSNVRAPITFAYAPDGRIFQGAQLGIIYVYDQGVRHEFIDLRSADNNFDSRNLRAIALDPQFAQNRQLYVLLSHRVNQPGSEILRVQASAVNPDVANLATLTTLLAGGPDVSQHVGGDLGFDPAGRLIASYGDGSDGTVSGVDQLRAQDLDLLNGKLIRIDRQTGAGVPGNPYYDPAAPDTTRSRILARGFRNPFRFHVDEQTGQVYVGDVGWATWEELDVVPTAWSNADHDLNFGWPCYEGGNGVVAKQPEYAANPDTAPTCAAVYTPAEGGTGVGSAAPLYAYRHSDPGGEFGSAIIAGAFNRTNNYGPQYSGALFFADFARDRFQTYTPGIGVADFGTPSGWGGPVDVAVAPNGNIAYLARNTSEIREIAHIGGNTQPNAVAAANRTSGPLPLRVQFSSVGSSDADGDPLTFSWDFDDGSAPSSLPNPSHRYTAAGSYDVTLTVADGHPGGTDVATLHVDAGNTPPTIRFTDPTARDSYRVGEQLPVQIEATDAEDGALTGADVTWEVALHHLGHVHPGEEQFHTLNGSFTAPDHGDDTYLEFIATAVDSIGAETTTSVLVFPETAPFAITTDPPGIPIGVDGQQQVTPFSRRSIIGGQHQITMPASATPGGITYDFVDLTANGTTSNQLTHAFAMPAAGYTVTARYKPSPPASNMLPNSSFETDASGWRAVRSTVTSATDAHPVDGSRVARVDLTSGSNYGINRATAVATTQPGMAYEAIAHVRARLSGAVGTQAQLVVRERTTDGSFAAEWSATVNLAMTFAPLRVVAMPQPGNVLEYQLTADAPASGPAAFATDLLSVVAVSAPAPPSGIPPGNVTVNPSFETNLAGWARSNAVLMRVVQPGAPAGSYVAQLSQRSNTNYSASTQLTSVAPAGELKRSIAFVRSGNTEAAGQRTTFSVVETTPTGAAVRTSSATLLLTGSYTPVQVETAATPGNTVTLTVRTSGTAAGITFIDAVTSAASG